MFENVWEGLRIIDISPPINEKTAVFPGDVPYQRDISMDSTKGDHMTLSSVTSTLHLGAHTDAPNHYSPDGSGIDTRSLNLYIGPCAVIKVERSENGKIGLDHLPDELPAPRILFKTGSFPDSENWNDDFWFFCPELVENFAHRGGILLGIDTPSIDPSDSKELPAHKAISENDLAILEGIVLDKVDPGLYNLIALPLPLVDADASPVRAVLIP
tara:strand:+ start:1103 stop:1744 length:642 start_codon:yes stop_codon:yes gene_type:complete